MDVTAEPKLPKKLLNVAPNEAPTSSEMEAMELGKKIVLTVSSNSASADHALLRTLAKSNKAGDVAPVRATIRNSAGTVSEQLGDGAEACERTEFYFTASFYFRGLGGRTEFYFAAPWGIDFFLRNGPGLSWTPVGS